MYTSPSKIKAIYLSDTQFIYQSIFLPSLFISIHQQTSIRLSFRPDPSLLSYFTFSLSFLPLLLLHYFPLSKVAFFFSYILSHSTPAGVYFLPFSSIPLNAIFSPSVYNTHELCEMRWSTHPTPLVCQCPQVQHNTLLLWEF